MQINRREFFKKSGLAALAAFLMPKLLLVPRKEAELKVVEVRADHGRKAHFSLEGHREILIVNNGPGLDSIREVMTPKWFLNTTASIKKSKGDTFHWLNCDN